MTPFDINPDNDAGHAIDQDDLIAFHLHELSPQQERALHRVLRNNPTLQAESVAIAATLHAFPKHEAALPLHAAALDRHWQALRNSLPLHVPIPTIAPQSFFTRWAIPAFAASALAATTLLVALHYAHRTQPLTVAKTEKVATPTRIPAPAETPQPNVPGNSESTPFHSRLLTAHRGWPLTSAPTETAATAPPAPIFPAEAPAPLAPASPSISAAGSSSAAATPASPSGPVQEQAPAQAPTPSAIQSGRSVRTSAVHRSPATELTLATFGDFTASHTSTFTSGSGSSLINESHVETATPSAGALASFHQQFSPWLGYRIAASYSRPTFEYLSKPISTSGQQFGYSGTAITHHNYELAGTYVVQGPHHRRLSTSIEAGAGVFAILSTDQWTSPTSNTRAYRAAAIAGFGSEFALSKHWALYAEYRAQLYKSPAIYHTSGSPLPTSTLTFTSNPILGLTYRFGTAGED